MEDTPDKNTLNFSSLYSPAMKSVYWKFFGFPADDHNIIKTKQIVVCLICHKTLTNHGNTTNLRAHLQHRHKAEFKELCESNHIQVPVRKRQRNSGRSHIARNNVSSHFVKYEYPPKIENVTPDHVQQTFVEKLELDMGEPMDEISENAPYDDFEMVADQEFDHVNTMKARTNLYSNQKSNNQIQNSSVAAYRANDVFVNIIVHYLHNIDLLYKGGIVDGVRTLIDDNGYLDCNEFLDRKRIEESILQLYTLKSTSLITLLKKQTKNKLYSICLEEWENVNSVRYVSIYFNYIEEENGAHDGHSFKMQNQFFTSVRYKKEQRVDELLSEFNLKNCVSVTTNYDTEDAFLLFFRRQDIPILLSYDVIINRCLQAIISQPEVADIIEEVKSAFDALDNHSALNDMDWIIPEYNAKFPWTYHEYLKFYSNHFECDNLDEKAQAIKYVMESLEKVMSSLKTSAPPYISIVWPFTKKVVTKTLAWNEHDDPFLKMLKSKVAAVFEEFVLKNVVLMNAAILDPRYHRLTADKDIDIQNCVQEMNAVFSKLQNESRKCSKIKSKTDAPSTSKNLKSKREPGDLVYFLDLEEDEYEPDCVSEPIVTIENELKSYRTVRVSFTESLSNWWRKFGKSYSYLNEIAPYYQCMAISCNSDFKKPLQEQMEFAQKRSNLSGRRVNEILFLYNHRDE